MKILFIHPFGIGDVIFSLAAAEALHRRGHTVDYLCNERTEELLRLCPPVRKTHRFHRDAMRATLRRSPLEALKEYSVLKRAIRNESYDTVLDFSMGREYAFLAWCAGIRRRIGWDWKGRGFWLTERVKITGFDDRSPRDFAMDLARLADPDAGSEAVYPRLKAPLNPDLDRWVAARVGSGSAVVLAPGGGESWGADAHYKQWPRESWVQLAQKLIQKTRAKIIIVGSSSEEPLIRAVAESGASGASGGRITTAVGEPLERVLGLLTGARVFVGTDGGLLHLANLAGTPTVGIYGPVSERGYAPLASAAPFRTVTADVPCRPCYRNFRFTGCAYEKRCLTSITPESIAAQIHSLLTPESL